MKKKLIKRLEELAIENERLKNVIEEHIIDGFKEKFKESIFEQMNDTGVVLDGITSKFKDSGKEEENKELEEAKEVVKDWRFGKCNYLSNEIDKAIETILNHLDNEKKN